ncbi:uncharacterized protein MELLADRAFT_111006 [Melampsora larici-populina 98AG31]|uniref:Uncharacterized protein n=1 Tax=Melampsora larici-populina (strain 98AG31 / pathotype 3-4-7) TaxID=747676 RepID=F4S1Q9_MELLP|nr:uncharacterized protein MELLADRAFT_111006 [Melampsora larici-populina 98AG31]EGG01417.1 hypothetical protein MELLADRAFT_111006 [Melampsora larici-populina 98AG31]
MLLALIDLLLSIYLQIIQLLYIFLMDESEPQALLQETSKQLAAQTQVIAQMQTHTPANKLKTLSSRGSVPVTPDPTLLNEFNARFFDSAQISAAANATASQELIPQSEIISLQEARAGHVKISRGIVYVQDFFVRYSLAMLAKLGIRKWGPDLNNASDSMWNEACWISAIQIFRMWVTGKAFPNVNPKFVNNLLLLEQTYNHYIHFLMTQKFKKESKEAGKNQKDDESFPERYIKMLRKTDAHSNDKLDMEQGIQIVKTPIYQSEAAGIFMRRLDEHMKNSDIILNKRSQRHMRLRPAEPIMSTFARPPRGLPLNFYNPEWWNNTLSQLQRDMIADCFHVMFLPDPSVSLMCDTDDEEEEEEEGDQQKKKGKGKGKAVPEDWANLAEFGQPIGGGKGDFYVDDDAMNEAEDDARATRWDLWNDACCTFITAAFFYTLLVQL